MNLDILETGPVKWWWYVVLSFSLFVMVLAGWAMFKYYSVCFPVPDVQAYSIYSEITHRLDISDCEWVVWISGYFTLEQIATYSYTISRKE